MLWSDERESNMLKEIMEQAIPLKVPVVADIDLEAPGVNNIHSNRDLRSYYATIDQVQKAISEDDFSEVETDLDTRKVTIEPNF